MRTEEEDGAEDDGISDGRKNEITSGFAFHSSLSSLLKIVN